MSTISTAASLTTNRLLLFSSKSFTPSTFFLPSPLLFPIFHSRPYPLSSSSRTIVACSKSSEEEEEVSETKDEWLEKLPDKKKAVYSHSLPCIEAWLRSLGFYQSRDDRALWFVEKPDWHAHLSLDITEIYIRYLKNGPGNLEKDVERRFSYALSREDIEKAILGGP